MRELSSDPGYSSERPPAGRRCTQVASVHSFLNSSGLYLTCSTSGAGAFVHDLNIHEAFFFFFFKDHVPEALLRCDLRARAAEPRAQGERVMNRAAH